MPGSTNVRSLYLLHGRTMFHHVLTWQEQVLRIIQNRGGGGLQDIPAHTCSVSVTVWFSSFRTWLLTVRPINQQSILGIIPSRREITHYSTNSDHRCPSNSTTCLCLSEISPQHAQMNWHRTALLFRQDSG